MQFEAQVALGIVPSKDNDTGFREARWIPASQIPDSLIQEWLNLSPEDKKHPRNINGMAWDLDKGAWRNMKNATTSTTTSATITFSLAAEQIFSVKE